MTTPEEKIRNLLARASHPNTPEEEARSCAVIAAKMMKEHKIEIGSVGSGPQGLGLDPFSMNTVFGFALQIMRAAVERTEQRPYVKDPLPPPPAPRTPFDELFWDRWSREHPTTAKPKRKRRRKRPNPKKRDPNWERKRK